MFLFSIFHSPIQFILILGELGPYFIFISIFQNATFLQNMHLHTPPRQTRSSNTRSEPKLLVCKKSAQGNIVGALKPDPQFGHFTLTALICEIVAEDAPRTRHGRHIPFPPEGNGKRRANGRATDAPLRV